MDNGPNTAIENAISVILTHDVWQRSFGGRPDVIGKTITLDHAPGYVIQGAFSVIPLLEPLAYGMAVLALGGVVMVASWVPAFRASRIHPASTLRAH